MSRGYTKQLVAHSFSSCSMEHVQNNDFCIWYLFCDVGSSYYLLKLNPDRNCLNLVTCTHDCIPSV